METNNHQRTLIQSIGHWLFYLLFASVAGFALFGLALTGPPAMAHHQAGISPLRLGISLIVFFAVTVGLAVLFERKLEPALRDFSEALDVKLHGDGS